MKDFFVTTIGVPLYPTTAEYLNAVYNLANRTILPDNQALKKLFKMFFVLGQKACLAEKLNEVKEWGLPATAKEQIEMYRSLEDFVDPEMRETLRSDKNIRTRLIPTFSNLFLPIESQPILSIDEDVRKTYSKDRQVDFAVLNDISRSFKDHTKHKSPGHVRRTKQLEIEGITVFVMLFYKTCGLELLHDLQCKPKIFTMSISNGCYFWERILHDIAPALQRYMSVYLPDIYDDLQKKDFSETLRNTTVNTCIKLEILHQLKNRSTIDIRQEKIAVVEFIEEENKSILYIKSMYAEGFQQGEAVLREMMSIFAGNDRHAVELLSDFILTYTTVLNKETFMRRKRLLTMPEDEVIWYYPKPEDPFTEVNLCFLC